MAQPAPGGHVGRTELDCFLHVGERLVVESLLRKGPAAPVEGVETVRGEQDSQVIRGDRLIEVFLPVRLVAFFQFLTFGRTLCLRFGLRCGRLPRLSLRRGGLFHLQERPDLPPAVLIGGGDDAPFCPLPRQRDVGYRVGLRPFDLQGQVNPRGVIGKIDLEGEPEAAVAHLPECGPDLLVLADEGLGRPVHLRIREITVTDEKRRNERDEQEERQARGDPLRAYRPRRLLSHFRTHPGLHPVPYGDGHTSSFPSSPAAFIRASFARISPASYALP